MTNGITQSKDNFSKEKENCGIHAEHLWACSPMILPDPTPGVIDGSQLTTNQHNLGLWEEYWSTLEDPTL